MTLNGPQQTESPGTGLVTPPRPRPVRARAAVILPLLALTAAAAAGVYLWTYNVEAQRLGERANVALSLHAETLLTGLEKFQVLPFAVARRADVAAALESGGDADMVSRVLGQHMALAGLRSLELVNRFGQVVATSEQHLSRLARGRRTIALTSPYLAAALQGRLGRGYFVGTEGARTYVFAASVRDGDSKVIGAVVARINLELIERNWALAQDTVSAVDGDQLILLSNKPERRLKPPTEANPAGWRPITKERYLHLLDWTVVEQVDRAPLATAAGRAALIAALAGLIATLGAWFLLERRMDGVRRLRQSRAAGLWLERRVEQRTRDLRSANDHLAAEIDGHETTAKALHQSQKDLVQAAKLAALGQMSAALAHEYNQPLGAIRAHAENAETLIARGKPEEAVGNLGLIRSMVSRLAALSGTLKTFARRPGTDIRPVDVGAVVRDALIILSPRMKTNKDQVKLVLPDDPVLVHAGALRLEQVLVNLITNGLDAAGDDGSVQVEITGSGSNVVVRVSDSGPGVAADPPSKVFDPFYTTKEVGKGLGLGLSIAYNIVKDFDGHLEAMNLPGGGACFTLHLRAARPVREAAE